MAGLTPIPHCEIIPPSGYGPYPVPRHSRPSGLYLGFVFGMSLNDPLLIIYGTDGECVLRVNSDGAVVHGDAETVKKGFLRKVFK